MNKGLTVQDILRKWCDNELSKLDSSNDDRYIDVRAKKVIALRELLVLATPNNTVEKGEAVYIYFDELTDLLIDSPISNVKKLLFVFYVMLNDIQAECFNKSVVHILEAFTEFEQDMFWRSFYNDDKLNKKMYHRMHRGVILRASAEKQLSAIQKIYDLAIQKPVASKEEIDEVLECFKALGIKSNFIAMARKEMTNNVEKRKALENRTEGAKVTLPDASAGVSPIVRTVPKVDRKYRLTSRQIEEYYNLETGKLERVFTLPEILMVAKLMKSIELPDYVIEDFVVKAEHTLILRSTDAISEYLELHDMLEFYKETNPELGNYIAQIDDCLLEMVALGEDDKEERKEWSNMVREDVEAALRLLPRDGKYVMAVTNGVSNVSKGGE